MKMSRYFNGQEVELLAPAGNFEIFKEIVKTGADAIYFGGKDFNMRMHRKDFNFTQDEISKAIQMAHEAGKKIYITVNNLLSHEELERLEDYLRFLEQVRPDALIVQDVSVIEMINRLGLDLNVHASIMMNVHNLPTINALRECGVTRVVASRELSLAQIKALQLQTDMEFEYFVHGDMCIAHGSQCTYSGIVFGQSGNRGRCMKPCRWNYQMKKDQYFYDTAFPLAVKDMAMYAYIPELIEAGVVSFKIEGRMRSTEYLLTIINAYSDAIDRYIEDAVGFDRHKDEAAILANRNRDLSTAYAFGKPGLNNINRRYEGTGRFYSTGKVFSKATEEAELSEKRVEQIKACLNETSVIPAKGKKDKPELAVRVNDVAAAKMAIEEGCEHIYLAAQPYLPARAFSREEILALTAQKGSSKLYLAMPRMMYEADFKQYSQYFQKDLGLDGLVVTELGGLSTFKSLGLRLIGDYSMNIYNASMAAFYEAHGLERATISIESTLKNTKEMLQNHTTPLEMIVHGRPVVMYIEHDLYENTEVYPGIELNEPAKSKEALYLIDEKDMEHPVYKDTAGRNHMLLSKELCYLPILKELYENGVQVFRIEGQAYDVETLRQIIKRYQKAMQQLVDGEILALPEEEGYTLGALQFN